MGVHISFVRSVNLDSWTLDQLRVMKVGGNANIAEFFRQHSMAIDGQDAKLRYSSRVAGLYKERLAKLSDEDARRFPCRIVLEGDAEDAAPVDEKPADFFDEANWGWEAAPKSSNPSPSKRVVNNNRSATNSPVPVQAQSSPVETSTETQERRPSVGSSSQPSSASVNKMLSSTATTSTGLSSGARAKKGKLGVKKVAISFDEMEAKAKEEAQRREELEKQGRLNLEAEQSAKADKRYYHCVILTKSQLKRSILI